MGDRDLPAKRRASALLEEETDWPVERTSFDYEVTLEPEDVVAAFSSDADVEWAEHGNPTAFPSAAGPQFQAWKDTNGAVLLRHAIPAGVLGSSPLVHIEITALPRGGSRVQGKFLRRPPSMGLGRWAKTFAIVGSSAYLVYAIAIWAWVGAVQPTAIVAIPIIIALFMQNNRPTRYSMEDYAADLWGLLGRKLVPHALGEHDSAFRDRALPSPRGEDLPDTIR